MNTPTPAPPFYAMQCKPGTATPATPLLYVVATVEKAYGPCVLAHLKRPGAPWTRFRYLFTFAEISLAPECFNPVDPWPGKGVRHGS